MKDCKTTGLVTLYLLTWTGVHFTLVSLFFKHTERALPHLFEQKIWTIVGVT